MWFPAHVAISYVIGRKTALDTRWCVLGSIVPYLADKSLGTLGVFPAYQTISHSLLGLSVVIALVFGRYGPPAVGWTVHIAADVVQLLVNCRGDHAIAMLGWPVLHWENPMVVDPSTAYTEGMFASIPFVQEGYVLHYLALPAFYLELVILSYAVWLLAFDPIRTPSLDGCEPSSRAR